MGAIRSYKSKISRTLYKKLLQNHSFFQMTTDKPSSEPQFLCIGHFCHDLHEGEYLLGGTASYCSLLAQKLGLQTAVLTSYGADFQYAATFSEAGVWVENKAAKATTLFENSYQKNNRTQYLHQRAATLMPADLPPNWKNIPIVKFCLIAGEADFSLLDAFPNAFIIATIQGWLRHREADGKIVPKEMDWQQLAKTDAVLLSEEDLSGFEDRLPLITSIVDLLVMTHGKHGATVFQKGSPTHYPAFPTQEVDPTGAGDVFGAAFLVEYIRTKEVERAIVFAQCAASIVIEGIGIHLPSRREIEERVEEYYKF